MILQPPRPRPPDPPWQFGPLQRVTLREACPGEDKDRT